MSANKILTRRSMLGSAVAVGGLSITSRISSRASAQGLVPTPECRDSSDPTPEGGEGPFYIPRSPERSDLIETSSNARIVELQGLVLSRSCRPVANALLDLWQADEHGVYDNLGFRYRAHIFSDEQGNYRFRTVLPGLYETRTRHFHMKVLAPKSSVLTTQLYFPDEQRNRYDLAYMPELLMRVSEKPHVLTTRFDFVLDLV
jgi:protocatechuate 3,4-dioxygenase beta subunit